MSPEWKTPGWSRLWHELNVPLWFTADPSLVIWCSQGVRGLMGNSVSQFFGGECDSCMSQIHIYSLADAFRPHFRCFNHWVCNLGNERFTLMLQAQGREADEVYGPSEGRLGARLIGRSVLEPDGQITHVFPTVPLPVPVFFKISANWRARWIIDDPENGNRSRLAANEEGVGHF